LIHPSDDNVSNLGHFYEMFFKDPYHWPLLLPENRYIFYQLIIVKGDN